MWNRLLKLGLQITKPRPTISGYLSLKIYPYTPTILSLFYKGIFEFTPSFSLPLNSILLFYVSKINFWIVVGLCRILIEIILSSLGISRFNFIPSYFCSIWSPNCGEITPSLNSSSILAIDSETEQAIYFKYLFSYCSTF